jgi:acyl carrier protein
MREFRIRWAVALTITLSLFAGCDSKSRPQTSAPKTEGAGPSQTASSDAGHILSGVRGVAAEQLKLEPGAVDVDAPLSKQKVAADELDLVEIIMKVEERFRVEIRDEEVSNPAGQLKDLSVRRLTDIVAAKKKKGSK